MTKNYIVANGYRIDLTENEMLAVFDAANVADIGTDLEDAYKKWRMFTREFMTNTTTSIIEGKHERRDTVEILRDRTTRIRLDRDWRRRIRHEY